MKKNLLFLAFALVALSASAQQTTTCAKAQQQLIAAPASIAIWLLQF